MKKFKALVFVNGDISCDFIFSFYKNIKEFFIVAVDGGFDKLLNCNIKADLYIGDLDSIVNKEKLKDIYLKLFYNKDKDETDLELALKYLDENKFKKADIIGFQGGRIDHVISHFFILEKNYKQFKNLKIKLISKNAIIYLIDNYFEISLNKGDIFSLLPLTEKVFVQYLNGAKYRLKNTWLYRWQLRGISNIAEDKVFIKIEKGLLIFIINL